MTTVSGRRSVVAAIAATGAGALPVFLAGALSVQVRADLGFGESAHGLAVSLYFAASAVTSAAAGRFVERAGAARGMRLAGFAAAASMAGLAIAARSWPVLVAFLVLGGLSNAVAQPGSNLLLARGVRSGRQGLAFGLKQAAIPASTLVAGLAVPAVALTVGWRWAFVAGAALALGAVLAVPGGGLGASPREEPEPPGPERPGGGAAESGGRRALLPLVLLAAAGGLGAAAANTLGAFLVEAAVRSGAGEGAAGLLFALGSVAGLGARVGGGALADRRGGDAFPAVAAMLVGGAVGFALLATGNPALLVPGTLLGFGLGWGWPGLFNYSIVSHYPQAPGWATGVTQTGVYLGGVGAPVAFGLLVEHLSFAAAWAFSAACALAAAAAIVTVPRLLLAPTAARRPSWVRAGRAGARRSAPPG